MKPLVVVVPSKTASNLAVSIPAVRRMEPDARIIVVSDGDLNGRDLVQCLNLVHAFPNNGSERIRGVEPFIFARNVNIGIRAAGDADVVLLNDDAVLESDHGFTLMQSAAEQNRDYGIIGAVTNQTGQFEQRPRNVGLRETEHIAFVCVLIPARTRHMLEALELWTKPDERKVFTGGYLDERYTAYGSDDLDYCMQVRAAGLKVGVHDGCFVDHNSLRSSFRGLPGAAGDIWPNHRLLRAKWNMPPNPADPMYKELVK